MVWPVALTVFDSDYRPCYYRTPISRIAARIQLSWCMRRARPANNRAVVHDTSTRYDELGFLLRRTSLPDSSNSVVSERWNRLAQRINAYQQLQALIAHMSAHGSEVRRSALLLRAWSSLTAPIA